MIHFKTINQLITKEYFFYDEDNDIYYTSTHPLNQTCRIYEYFYTHECWDYAYIEKDLSKFINRNIIIEDNDITFTTNDIIAKHNKKYKRLQKINKLS